MTISAMPVHGRYWVNTVSLEHLQAGVAGGFTQADHGRDTRLRRLRPGDGLVFYSPRTRMRGGTPVQQFTEVCTVVGEAPYQVEMRPGFRPWRLAVDFHASRPVPARTLVEQLGFVTDPARWGLPFRRGLFEIPEEDFRLIADAMAPATSRHGSRI